MDLNRLREEIAADEGIKHEIYLDHLGLPTFGIGHLVTESDPEHGEPVGTEVSEERVVEAFDADVETVLADCEELYDDFAELPEEVQLIIANMMFNMGRPRLSKFKGMKRGVDARDWNAAADEMVDSRWYKQVTNRAERLVERMRDVAEVEGIPV
jgi:lysozyme